MDLARQYPKVAPWIIAALAALGGVLMILPFAPAILWGVVLTILFWPLVRRIERRLGRGPAAFLTTLLILLAIGVPILALGTAAGIRSANLIREIEGHGFAATLKDLQTSLAPLAKQVGFQDFELNRLFEENREGLIRAARPVAGNVASYLGALLFNLIVALFAAFFFLRDSAAWEEPALRLMGLPDERGREILKRIADTVHGVFIGTVLVAVVQGMLVGILLALVKGPSPLALGMLTFGVSLVPILGAPLVYLPVAGLLFLQGNTVGGAVLLGAGILIVSQVDNLLRPFIVGQRVSLHPFAVFLFILGGAAVIGPVGLMAGPMILALLIGVRDLILESREPQMLVSPSGEVVMQATEREQRQSSSPEV